jgi:hypothetical protein
MMGEGNTTKAIVLDYEIICKVLFAVGKDYGEL